VKARVAQVKVAPQSGSARFICWKAMEMKNIGTKARMVTIGSLQADGHDDEAQASPPGCRRARSRRCR
jgi:hypothetical protein